MDLIPTQVAWPWVLPTAGAVVLVLLLWWARRTGPRRSVALPVAHTATLRSLPRYRLLARRQRRLGLLLAAGALLVIAGAAFVTARPQTVETSPRESRARDLMVCLDASASMDDDNAVVVRELRRIVEQLRGDRVGMMIWSSAAVLVFPLTDDYDYVRGQLDRAERAFTGHPDGFYAGVDLPDAGASLIGDGIVSCARRFDGTAAWTSRRRVCRRGLQDLVCDGLWVRDRDRVRATGDLEREMRVGALGHVVLEGGGDDVVLLAD